MPKTKIKLKTKKESDAIYKKVLNCRQKCSDKYLDTSEKKKKSGKKCFLKKQKTGMNYRKCMRMEGFDISKDWKNVYHCEKTKCKKLEKESKEYNKALLNQAKKKTSNTKKCCKCCAGKYFGKSYDCVMGLLPCCKGVSACKKKKLPAWYLKTLKNNKKN